MIQDDRARAVAHDARTVLTAILSEVAMLEEDKARLPDDLRRPVELLADDATRLRSLLDELFPEGS
ncbi:MAG TPA: histidine kinase dimerization/phospho-acceptor domain-containing protein [Actinomycetota bacterium]|nr:histidine kinase dimerization/phospho-acceptor domain-containing protein [Actinomycetota bacterium]